MVEPASTASHTEQSLLARVLDPVNMDPSGRKACLQGTRRNIIDPILDWANNLSSNTKIHWVHGDAGLGKSAIAHSVSEERRGLCGGYLFFDRDDPTSSHPSRVIRTIAYQLAINNSNIRIPILRAIERNPKIATETLPTQFTKLLHIPLTACRATLDSPLLVILDALDECGDDETRRVLVDLIAKRFTALPPPFKFLITSRAESDIVNPFMTSPNVNRINRVELLASTSTGDVLKFLYHGLYRICETRPSCGLLDDWPGRPIMLKLSRYMEGVFILASTAVSFLASSFNPESSLDYLLFSNSNSSVERLGGMFATVLESVGNWKNPRFVDEYRAIVSAVVVGQVPMTVQAIDQLLALKRSSSIILSSLRFLVRYSEDKPIRILHASIADYLTDPKRCGSKPWFIDIPLQHRFLTHCCLRLMKEQLRFNMCSLETSHLLNEDVPDLRQRVRNSISDPLVYACQYFAAHLHLSNTPSDYNELDFFMRSQLLFWLEVLSLVGENKAAIPAMDRLGQWYRNSNNKELTDLAYEVVKFMTVFRGVISQSTPHLYASGVPMWRESSHIKRIYGHKFREIVRTKHSEVDAISSLQRVMRGHTGHVSSVKFSPDGKRIVSGSQDQTVRIWDAETGFVVAGPFKGHTSCITSVGFSPNGQLVVSGSEDSRVLVSDAETGSVVAGPFKGHTDYVTSVGFSPDGKRIISGSRDKTVRIWDAGTGSLVAGPFKGHTGYVTSVAFSPDGERLVSGSEDQTLRIWDVNTGNVVAGPFNGHSDWVTSVVFSPDGKHIVSSSDDKTLRIWDAEAGSAVTGPFNRHTGYVTSVAFSPDGKCVVSGSQDKTVLVWDIETGSVVAGPFKGHTDYVTSVAFSPDGKRIVSGSRDTTVLIWDAESPESPDTESVVARPSDGHIYSVTSVAFLPDGRRVISGSQDGTVRIWDAETGTVVAWPFSEQSGHVTLVGVSPDGQRIVTGSQDTGMQIRDARNFMIRGLYGHTGHVTSVAFSLDGKRIVSGSRDKTVRIWDAGTGSLVSGPFKGHTDWVTSVGFSPDGKRVVSGSQDRSVRIWYAQTGVVVARPFYGHTGHVTSVGFSPDGRRVVSGSRDKTMQIWDVKTKSVVAVAFKGHTGCITSVAFSPDGKCVVSGSQDRTAWIWDAETGSVVAGPFKGHVGCVTSVGFSPDGKRIVSGSEDQLVRIWDVETGSRVHATSDNPCTWSLHDDGWLRSASGALILWIPHYYPRSALCFAPSLVIGVPMIQIDLSRFVHGARWTECLDVTVD